MRSFFSGEEVSLDDVDPAAGCISCKHVTEEGKPVLVVSSAGGDWIMICGSPEHYHDGSEVEELCVTHFHHLFEADETLLEIIDMPDDRFAERKTIGGPWIFSEDKDEE